MNELVTSQVDNGDKANIVIEAQSLSKTFYQGGVALDILQHINLKITRGQLIAIVGASGSGKSTLLHCLGGLDKPSAGKVLLCGSDINNMKRAAQGRLRGQNLGFVYQFHHLLQELTALENVAMPLLINGVKTQQAKQQATEVLKLMGLEQRLQHKPAQLSGGERQRTAIARALVHRPACVLADEPTGNLDKRTAEQVYDLMLKVNTEIGTSLVVVTHDLNIAARMDYVYRLEYGFLSATAEP